MKRSAKFWRTNEREVMARLGMQQTQNSGSGWVEKGDGQNDNIVCELKSTDAASYRLRLEDLRRVEHHAAVAHKLPVFAVQFLGSDEIFLVVKPSELSNVAQYMEQGDVVQRDSIITEEYEQCVPDGIITIKSSKYARIAYEKENENKYSKRKKAAT